MASIAPPPLRAYPRRFFGPSHGFHLLAGVLWRIEGSADRFWWGRNGRRPATGLKTGKTTTPPVPQILSTIQLAVKNRQILSRTRRGEGDRWTAPICSKLKHYEVAPKKTCASAAPLCKTRETDSVIDPSIMQLSSKQRAEEACVFYSAFCCG